ncbi:MAG: PorV/PorQ family protein [Candidatus Eisenbacteria bacterium]|nr:PorV/PorQ family protein [Candidatus Eisenbacteria bacterium]
MKGWFMNKSKRFVWAGLGLLIIVACMGPVGEAQTYGGTGVLKIKPAARASGMGQSGVALYQRAHSIWWNPALLAQVGNAEGSLTVAKLVPGLADDVYYMNVAGAKYLEGWGGVAANIMYLSYGQTEAVDTEGTSWGFFTSYEFVPSVGFGTQLIGGPPGSIVSEIDVGVALKYVWVDLAPEWAMEIVGVQKDGRADAFAVDLGMLWAGELFLPYALGVNVQNLGSTLVYIEADEGDPLPRNLKAGLALQLYGSEAFRVIATFDYNRALIDYPDATNNLEARPKFGWGNTEELLNSGVEVSFYDRLNFRAGYVDDPEGEIQAPTFGAGLDVNVSGDYLLRFDYSSVPQALDLDRVHYISVGVLFE